MYHEIMTNWMSECSVWPANGIALGQQARYFVSTDHMYIWNRRCNIIEQNHCWHPISAPGLTNSIEITLMHMTLLLLEFPNIVPVEGVLQSPHLGSPICR